MRHYLFLITLFWVLMVAKTSGQSLKWHLVWGDEFNYKGLPDKTKWNYDVGDNGWGNNEKQYYTYRDTANARADGKHLIIEAKNENDKYTSARLLTKGNASWQYGKIEVRAKLPAGRGSWPAIWMLAENMKQWPEDGEIDIMEHVGYNYGVVHASVHTKKYNHVINTQKTNTIVVKDLSTKFHLYTVEWNKYKVIVSVDNKPYFTYNNEHSGYAAWPFDNAMCLILNIAVGGNWGGQKGIDDTSLRWKMLIDYVRVYQLRQ